MQLALLSGIAVREWLAGDPRDVDTALVLLQEQSQARRRHG